MRKRKKESKPLSQHPCKNCGKIIPIPMEFCSSECRRYWNMQIFKNKDKQTDLVNDYDFPEAQTKLKLGEKKAL